MNPFTQVKRQLITQLQEALEGQGILVGEAFPDQRHQALPPQRRIAVGIAAMELPGASRIARLTIRFDILSPKQDASGCHQVFEALAEQLTNGGYGVQKLSCQQVTYSQPLDCLCCTATAELTGIFSADETGTSEGWQEIVIKTKGA